MPAEQFANLAQTQLTAGVNASVTSLALANGGAPFPSQAQFRVRVEDLLPGSGINVELMLVTAGAGTSTWTVTRGIEGTTAVAHAAGSAVTQVVTAGALATFSQYALAGVFTKAQAIQPDSDATPLILRPNAAQTGANPLLRLDNTAARPSPYILAQGAQRNPPTNTTPYTTQIGGMGGSNPGIVTNSFVSIAGQTDAGANGFTAAPAIAAETSYMLGISSDVSPNPAVVIKGGDNLSALIRGYSAAGVKVLDMLETGQLQVPVQGVAGGLLLGGDTNLYRSAADTLSTDDAFITGAAKNLQTDFITDRANDKTWLSTNTDATHTWVLTNRAAAAAKTPLSVRGAPGQSVDIFRVEDSAAAFLSGFDKSGFFKTKKTAAPADADLAANEMALWFDATSGAPKLALKAKDSAGTVASALWALTKPTITGSRGGNAALASLLTGLATAGFITDSTTA